LSDSELRQKVEAIQWFHDIDFGGGIVAKGGKSANMLKSEAELYFGSLSLSGRTLIDVGAWNGFFSIEAKRRGAERVLATDHFAWTTALDGRPGFELARERLAPDVEDMVIDIPDLTVERVGMFDAVLFAGVFYHLPEAPRYLMQTAALARHVLIVETQQDLLDIPRPAMAYYPGTALSDDPTNFWGPNVPMMAALLREAGFAEIRYQPNGIELRGVYLAFRDRDSMETMGFHESADASMWRNLTAQEKLEVTKLSLSVPRNLRNFVRFLRRKPMG
jgi:tRNA (mo5U34)-methyltransferase